VTGPAAPPLPPELDALVRRMRLPYLRKAAPDVLATARAQRWEPAEVLRVLLAEEVTGRDAATRRMRRKTAGFPSGKTFSSWRPEDSSIAAATQDALATLEWIGRAENQSRSQMTSWPRGQRGGRRNGSVQPLRGAGRQRCVDRLDPPRAPVLPQPGDHRLVARRAPGGRLRRR